MTTPADVLRRWATERLATETSERLDPDLTRVWTYTSLDDTTHVQLTGRQTVAVGPNLSDPYARPFVELHLELDESLLAELAAYQPEAPR